MEKLRIMAIVAIGPDSGIILNMEYSSMKVKSGRSVYGIGIPRIPDITYKVPRKNTLSDF